MKKVNLCILVDEGGPQKRVLLAMKKRGFGAGKWNGVGGKVRDGESIESSMVRETREEIGVDLIDYHKVAILTFVFDADRPGHDWNHECHVYLATKWVGEPMESEEMRPRWYSASKIPYNEMWPDDSHWLPLVLSGKKLRGTFVFNKEKIDKLESFDIQEVQKWE